MSNTTTSSVCRRLTGIFAVRVPTNTVTTNSGSSKSGKFQKMVRKFKTSSESDDFRSRHDIYSNTVLRLAKYKRFSMIREILDHQKNFKDITDEPFTSRLITLYGKAGMFHQARKLFDEMPDLNCSRTVYSFNALLSACIDAGKFDELEGIVKDLPHKLGITLDVISYNTVIKGFCKMGALDSAAMVLEEMVKLGVKPNVITFNPLLHGFYGNGRSVDGERIWGRMVEMNVVANVRSYNAKLFWLVTEKRMKEAVELVEDMRSKKIVPDLYTFNALIKGFVKDGNLEEAKLWYGEIQKNDFAPDNMTFETLVTFLCGKGDFYSAYEICKEIFSRRFPIDVKLFQPVVDGLVNCSKIQEAEKLVQLAKRKFKITIPS